MGVSQGVAAHCTHPSCTVLRALKDYCVYNSELVLRILRLIVWKSYRTSIYSAVPKRKMILTIFLS